MTPPKIALIDDGINPGCLPRNLPHTQSPIEHFIEHFIADGDAIRPCNPESGLTHGSACYSNFLRHTHAPHRLISIKVLDSETGTGSKNALVSALKWCSGQGIDLLHMSMGTRQYLDFAHIAEAVEDLSGTVIVAACSNQNTLTFPACLPGVIGVRHCGIDSLRGRFAWAHSPYDQINAFTCVEGGSNSAAAPVVSARVCDYLADGAGLAEILDRLKEDSVTDILKDPSFLSYGFYKDLLAEWEEFSVPVVAWPLGISEPDVSQIRKLLAAFTFDGYRAVCFSSSVKTDVRDFIFRLDPGTVALPALIELYYNFTLPDIVFLHMDVREAMSLPDCMKADIVVEPSWLGAGTDELFAKIKGLLS